MAARSFSTYVPFCDMNQGTCPFVGLHPSPGMVAARPLLVFLRQLRFRNPRYFNAGEIHMAIIRDGVHVKHFFKPFNGNFRGSPYNGPRPPPIHLGNAPICEQFQTFISDTIVDWVSTSVLAVWGRVGEVRSPIFKILPLTMQPSKPRLFHDERLHLSQIRSRRHKCSSLTRGFLCPNI